MLLKLSEIYNYYNLFLSQIIKCFLFFILYITFIDSYRFEKSKLFSNLILHTMEF